MILSPLDLETSMPGLLIDLDKGDSITLGFGN